MAISIDWGTKVISIPKADLTLIQLTPTEIREMSLNWFRLQLKSLEDDAGGMPFLKTHDHNTEVLLGGLTYARVIEILDPYTITFEDGQYAVNLVGANSNVGDKVNVNQVSVRSSNSAGMTSTPLIEHAAFNGSVSIDTLNGKEGTLFDIGTTGNPVKLLSDALLIEAYRKFGKFFIIGNATIDSGEDYSSKIFEGESITKTLITVTSAANVYKCEFYNATVQGTLDGESLLEHCRVLNLNYINGNIIGCLCGPGTIVLGGNANAQILDCWSGGAIGDSYPIVDMGGSGQSLGIRGYNGAFGITNKSGIDRISIDLNSGYIILDNTVTNGEIVVRGIGKLVDENGDHIPTGNWNGCTIINETISQETVGDAVWDKILP